MLKWVPSSPPSSPFRTHCRVPAPARAHPPERPGGRPPRQSPFNPRAVGILRCVARLVVWDGLGDLHQRLAAHQFRADDRELDVNIPSIGIIPQLVCQPCFVPAHYSLDSKIQQMCADLNLRSHARHIIHRKVDHRRQALIHTYVLDVIVNHMLIECRLGFTK